MKLCGCKGIEYEKILTITRRIARTNSAVDVIRWAADSPVSTVIVLNSPLFEVGVVGRCRPCVVWLNLGSWWISGQSWFPKVGTVITISTWGRTPHVGLRFFGPRCGARSSGTRTDIPLGILFDVWTSPAVLRKEGFADGIELLQMLRSWSWRLRRWL